MSEPDLHVNFEEALRNALRQQAPPAGFAGRVLARAAERRRKRMARNWMAIAALFAAGAFVTAEVRTYEAHREAEARKAGHQLLIALKITGSKLHATTRMMRRRSNGV
jgi:hypothetical protein